jgi:hypothetical protein
MANDHARSDSRIFFVCVVCFSVTDSADFCDALRVADAARVGDRSAPALDLSHMSPAGIEPTFKV